MSAELTLLVYAIALLIVVILIQATTGVLAQGLPPMAGNRDDLPPPKVYQGRTKRLVDNYVEGMVMYAPLALVAAVANVSSDTTILAAQLFFYGRLAHAIVYLVGIPWVRTLAWAVSLAGTLMLLLVLLGIMH